MTDAYQSARVSDELYQGTRDPKNVAALAIERVELPDSCQALIKQTVDWRVPGVCVLVEIPGGPACRVEILEADDPRVLAARVVHAAMIVLDAERRQLELRGCLWADQHPEALQCLVDPAIRIVGDELTERWGLPAGWVGIVNRLHADLVELLGYYEIVRVGNKLAYLRYAIDRHRRDDGGPDAWSAVNARLQAAKRESLATCDLCGKQADGTISRGVTRCPRHPAERPDPIRGATARPPGWLPDSAATPQRQKRGF